MQRKSQLSSSFSSSSSSSSTISSSSIQRLLPTRPSQQQKSSKLNLMQMPMLLVAVISWCAFVPLTQAKPVPFDQHGYPTIDIRLLDWPQAQKSTDDDKPYTQLECYTEMDGTFIDPNAIYRVNNSGQLRDRACMLRIPTGTRLTVLKMHVHNRKSYVTILAGSSQVFMPLRTEHIHADQPDRYGPWHVPCNKAYIVFQSKSSAHHHLEWVEFRLTKETEEDRTQADSEQCTSEGVNHAQVEYGTTNEEEGEEATDAAPEEGHQRHHDEHQNHHEEGQAAEVNEDETIKHSRQRRNRKSQ